MNREGKRVRGLTFLVLFLFFVGISFVLVTMGANAYKRTNLMAENQFFVQTPLSYIRMKVRQNDRVDGVKVGKVEDEVALVLREEIEGIWYETWLYQHAGYLKEAYIKEGDRVALEDGEKVIELSDMMCKINEQGMVHLELEMVTGEKREEQITLQSVQRGESE